MTDTFFLGQTGLSNLVPPAHILSSRSTLMETSRGKNQVFQLLIATCSLITYDRYLLKYLFGNHDNTGTLLRYLSSKDLIIYEYMFIIQSEHIKRYIWNSENPERQFGTNAFNDR